MSRRKCAEDPVVWILNLDAELELGARGSYAPSARVRAIVDHQAARLIGPTSAVPFRSQDIVLRAGQAPDPRAAGRQAVAWCPTPRALASLHQAQARPLEAPSLDTLRKVNARDFARSVRLDLLREQPTGTFGKDIAATLEEVLPLIARPAPAGWLVRRPFGAAGRGRRRLYAGQPTLEEMAWLRAGLWLGPLVVEPFVEVMQEFTRSGFVRRDGSIAIAGPALQATDGSGAWTGSQVASSQDLKPNVDRSLASACQAAGEALARAGYCGPFGIDAFLHRSAGKLILNPLSEINARLTMDWFQTMDRAELLGP